MSRTAILRQIDTIAPSDLTYQEAVPVPRSGNPWIDGLISGYRWGVTSVTPEIGFTFIGSTADQPGGLFGGYSSWGWGSDERMLMLESIAAIEQVSGLRFVDRGDNNDDNVEIWFYNLDGTAAGGVYGFSYTPGSGPDEGLVAINWSAYRRADGDPHHSITPGSFHGLTYLHELSHAIGLKHPHARGLEGQPRFPGLNRGSNIYRDAGLHGQNAQPWTQLTYVDQKATNGAVPSRAEAFGFLQTPGALDIAALQWMYGINPDAAAGNDVYELPTDNGEGVGWHSIWDTGGRDRIDASRASAPVTIDLRNATLDLSPSAGGFLSRVQGVYGGFTIAHDWDGHGFGEPAGICVIEDATGGRADDWLIGNAAGNLLKGRRGDDVLYAGAAGPDRLKGGPGRDQFWIASDPGAFVTVADFSPRSDVLVFDRTLQGVDLVAGRDGTDVLMDGVPVAYLAGATEVTLADHALVQPFELPS